MEKCNLEYLKSQKGVVRLGIISTGFLTFILVVSAPYCEGALIWVAVAFLISTICSLTSLILIVKSWTSKLPVDISYQDVDIYLTTFTFFNSLLASIVLAINARSTALWIIAAVFGFGMVSLYTFDLYLEKDKIPENLKYMKTCQGSLKTFIFVSGFITFSLLDASTLRCYYPDGCDSARIWVFAAFFSSWFGSSLFFLFRLSWISSGISCFDRIDLAWSVFSSINYLVAALVLSAYLKCVSFLHYDCGCRLASNLFGYFVAFLYGFDVYLFVKSADDVITAEDGNSGGSVTHDFVKASVTIDENQEPS